MRLLSACLLLSLSPLLANAAEAPARVERGNLLIEGIPAIPAELNERLNRYQQVRGAGLGGWLPDGSLLISTRFGETSQVHRVKTPLGARSQQTFFPEPVAAVAPHPRQLGFVFAKDQGGDEFYQLYWQDLASGETRLLSDGKSRNGGALWSGDGSLLALSTTRRNGKDTDLHVLKFGETDSVPVLEREGSWTALDFSPDNQTLLVQKSISINESELYLLDLGDLALTRFHDTPQPVAFGSARFAKDGKGIYFTSDEGSEFMRLHYQALSAWQARLLSAEVPWNVEEFSLSGGGGRLAYVSNEDGLAVLHLLDLKTGKKIAAPKLPAGQIGGIDFDPRGRQLAFSLDRATAPSDIYSFRVGEQKLSRWTESEVGGLNTADFIEPQLIRYPSFDGLSIPAFVYRPKLAAGVKAPVIVSIHGGPEAQALPSFSPISQYYLKELGAAVITPNVRGSDGYGKSYLKLDNGYLRKDSVKDIGALLDWIATQPDLDAGRVLVMGGSYGGYMTLASMVDYNDRLRAGVDVVGISHFVTFLTNTQDYRRDLRRVEYGDERIPEMRAYLEEIAPLSNAQKITKPMLMVQGLNDPRVPASEAEQMVAKMRANGGVVWYLAAKDEGHGFKKKSNRDYQTAATVLFLKQTLLGE
ncbi:MAG: S9 family peptidase [Nevskiaceae bacterium]|nr:MAG: S9 family peptidase [Nevskiaceae bacterium]TAM22724.1 MAG: S9 family peptidase [Nevskiaceae bacterium]